MHPLSTRFRRLAQALLIAALVVFALWQIRINLQQLAINRELIRRVASLEGR